MNKTQTSRSFSIKIVILLSSTSRETLEILQKLGYEASYGDKSVASTYVIALRRATEKKVARSATLTNYRINRLYTGCFEEKRREDYQLYLEEQELWRRKRELSIPQTPEETERRKAEEDKRQEQIAKDNLAAALLYHLYKMNSEGAQKEKNNRECREFMEAVTSLDWKLLRPSGQSAMDNILATIAAVSPLLLELPPLYLIKRPQFSLKISVVNNCRPIVLRCDLECVKAAKIVHSLSQKRAHVVFKRLLSKAHLFCPQEI
jgi:hypothetical protein